MTSIAGSITGELHDPGSPLRNWLCTHLPNTKRIQKEFRESVVNKCLEPPKGARVGTIGTAFDYLVRFTVTPDERPEAAALGAAWAQVQSGKNGPDWMDRFESIASRLSEIAECLSRNGGEDQDIIEELIRGCWALALFTEVGRAIDLRQSPLSASSGCDVETWFGCSDSLRADELKDLAALYNTSRNNLIPFIRECGGPHREDTTMMGPLAGDADIMAGPWTIEIKAIVDRRKQDGTPRYGLDLRLLYQVVCYGLLSPPEYGIQHLALYNARYNHLFEWKLDDVLSELAGHRICARDVTPQLISFLHERYDD
ncbi:hypothetical protein [Mycobacteroides abscessus]|uniref:hypothetical protein n=1 Tax=Mycobacteroides abscessus TaxID=36809 RepID=UPI000D6A1502|nr:hypothetical protein [Mycobacteroides abscessus]MDO3333386.1 hypothetical protein [Mycobacteroides abscessus subsp. bolletii]QSM89860.1 hypothetical protein I3U44_03785 [Mycobacteroides abscessus subsp. bolletii]